MKELIVKIRHNNCTEKLTAEDVQQALENIFALSTNFEVEEIDINTKE
ncbi:MAG: hypothetical protein GY853_11220 [PVC group bacterium]|nr:hypothetical protein [PVC group bacterium]